MMMMSFAEAELIHVSVHGAICFWRSWNVGDASIKFKLKMKVSGLKENEFWSCRVEARMGKAGEF